MGCAHEIVRDFQLIVAEESITVKGLDSMVHLTFLSQPQSNHEAEEMMYDAYLEYNQPFSGDVEALKKELLHAYMKMKTELEDRLKRYRSVEGK